MGILDDAIREHLELKRRRGASDDELAKEEAEALGPARRQPATADAEAFDAEPLEADAPMPPPDLSTAADADAPPPPEDFAPLDLDEAPPPAPPTADEPEPDFSPIDELETDPGDRLPPHGDIEPVDPEPARGDTVAFEEPVAFDEPAEPIHAEPSAEDPIAPPPRPEPESELDFPATEVMAADDPAAAAEPADPEATRAHPLPPLDDDSLPPEPAVPDAPGEDNDDVLEETPDFLQDTPDHDRLWFEQKPPRDFDFDD